MRALTAAALLALASCAPAVPAPRAWSEERARQAARVGARERAPDLWGAAQAAAKRAERSKGRAADEARGEARLWLEAAIVEAERLELAEQRLGVERETEQLLATAARDERARLALHEQANLRAAAQAAREAAARALERAAEAPHHRAALEPSEERAAGQALLLRARLVLAALVQLGADPAGVEQVQRAIDDAASLLAKRPAQGLEAADQALFRAHALFGPLRARVAAPTVAQRRALHDALRVAGASVARAERGLSASLRQSFRGVQLTPSARRKLARLCALATAHPHGPLRLQVSAKGAAQRARRAHHVLQGWTRAGCDAERVGTDAGVSPAEGDLSLTWVAY